MSSSYEFAQKSMNVIGVMVTQLRHTEHKCQACYWQHEVIKLEEEFNKLRVRKSKKQ